MRELDDIRLEIDEIDGRLARLVRRRLELAGEIAAAKAAKGIPIVDEEREKVVLAHVIAETGRGLEKEAEAVFKTLFALSRERQRAALQALNEEKAVN